ncbi:GNAT family protein [Sporosarcina sp. 179-K 8C2 HS]|uniref:GNAT family N-acetyltransferase n=1 Tax=Sporosarcina sp. 179-K 8C2 HS TaxID=3142387 RepID=UPI00399FD487
MLFSGERVRLRKMAIEDVSSYHKWRNDIEVMQFTSLSLDVFTYADTENFVKIITGSHNSKGYMIEEISTDKPIGVTSLINIDYGNRNAECIIDIGEKDYWNKGFGREAFQLLLDFAFDELNLHKVYLRVFSYNERAIKLYQKLGFSEDGRLTEQLYRNGSWHDVILMGLLKRNYRLLMNTPESGAIVE